MADDAIPPARLEDCLAVTTHALAISRADVLRVMPQTGGLFNFLLRVETSKGVCFFKQYLDDVPNPLYDLPNLPAAARARLACEVQLLASQATQSLGREVVPTIVSFDRERSA